MSIRSRPTASRRLNAWTCIAMGLALSNLVLSPPRKGSAAVGEWESHGPAGNIRSLALAPSDPSVLYGGLTWGIVKSTDAGRSWKTASDGVPPDTQVPAFAVDPTDPLTAYAATDGGMFKTTDGGEHWEARSRGITHVSMDAVAIDSTDPQIIYAGARSGIPGGIMYKSTDGAATWSDITGAIQSPIVQSIAIDPNDSLVVYVGTFWFGVLYKSTDGGATWARSSSGFPTEETVSAIAIDPSDPERLYAATSEQASPGPEVYLSTDAGATWVPAADGPGDQFMWDLAIDPSHPATVYSAGEYGVYKSRDHGISWTHLGGGLPITVEALEIDPFQPDILYASRGPGAAGEALGMFKTTDGGTTWKDFTLGLTGLFVIGLAMDPTDPDTIYAGPPVPRVSKSTDGGRHWTNHDRGLGSGGPGFTDLVVDPTDPQVVYGTLYSFSASVMKSTDGGRSWVEAGQGVSGGPSYDLDMDPTDPSHLALASGRVYLSTDGARTWTLAGPDAPRGSAASVKFDPTDPRTIYAGFLGDLYRNGGLYKSTDGGRSWRALLRLHWLNLAVFDIEVDPTDPATVYLGVGNSISGEVLKSTDAGDTWSRVGAGTITGAVGQLALDPTDHATIYAATRYGVYVSHDAGATWSDMSDGLLTRIVYRIVIDPTGSRLYLSGPGGVYRFDIH